MAAPLGLALFGDYRSRGVAPGYWNGWPFGPEEKIGPKDGDGCMTAFADRQEPFETSIGEVGGILEDGGCQWTGEGGFGQGGGNHETGFGGLAGGV